MEPERPSLTMPEELTRRAIAVATGDDGWQVQPARDAATVVLLRDGAAGVEVFLQRRVGRMAFAPGQYVFPGGRVEDSDATAPWRGAAGEPFPIAPGAGVTACFRALTTAGARETWEEAGTVLAGDGSGQVGRTPAEPTDDFESWLRHEGLFVDGDRFAAWSHWITPEIEGRRFDTRFLVAELPDGQEAVDLGVESDHSSWFTPASALDRTRAGTMPMLPPTSHALMQLADFDSASAVMADARTRRPRPLLPRPAVAATGAIEWGLVDAYTGEPMGWS